MKVNFLWTAVLACFLAGSVARADSTYIYSINLPDITNAGAENDAGGITAYPFSWVGPLQFNAAAGTSCPTLCGPPLGTTVNAGYFFDGFSFTADLALSDAEVLVKFASFSDPTKLIVFSFIEPDSFWSTTGTGRSFPTVAGTPSFTFDGGSATACTGCTVDISTVASTPEPSFSFLVAALIGLIAVAARSRQKKSPAIG